MTGLNQGLRRSEGRGAEVKDPGYEVAQRRLREKGTHWRKKTKKPFVSDKYRKKRLALAKKHAGWDLEHWKRVIWNDESPFTLKNSSSQFVWRTNGEKTASRSMQGTINHQKSIKVWGCFSWNGVGGLQGV